MPFIKQEDRERIDSGGSLNVVGDLCYVAYKHMVSIWKGTPRWTTAHSIYKTMHRTTQDLWWLKWSQKTNLETEDFEVASSLAWQVFFNIYVMDYERKKLKENGDI
ncbi:MAG: hypothetical protein KAS32_12975 [Candidatus Peribacteraceae bacterium]|nr:hypothetical protein [Candidatus Peribacteraceae bacterium]